MKVVGIYLTVDEQSTTNKLASPIGTMSLGSLALETTLNSLLDKVIIITQDEDDADWIPIDMKSHKKVTLVKCQGTQQGKSESLHVGIEQAIKEKADAAMVILADQPFITVLMINEIIVCMTMNPACNYVATRKEESLIFPILFSASMFPSLLKVADDSVAENIIGMTQNMSQSIPCQDNRFIVNIDKQ